MSTSALSVSNYGYLHYLYFLGIIHLQAIVIDHIVSSPTYIGLMTLCTVQVQSHLELIGYHPFSDLWLNVRYSKLKSKMAKVT